MRKRCIEYLRENRESYEVFLGEDELPYEGYLGRMAKEGTWGGQIELLALGKGFGVNVRAIRANRRVSMYMD